MASELQTDLSRRLVTHGERRLSDTECLALLLAADRSGAIPLLRATRLLARVGGLGALRQRLRGGIAEDLELRPRERMRLLAASGLARRLAEAQLVVGTVLRSAREVAELVRDRTLGELRESFHVVEVDARHRVRRVRTVSIGGLCSAPVHPREVFGPALALGAAALVVAHNHPSGDPAPSEEDALVTERLRRVGEMCGVEMLDHVVVGDGSYYSFSDQRSHPLAAREPESAGTAS